MTPLALVTRPEPAATSFARRLEAGGWRTVVSPVLIGEAIVPARLPDVQGVIFTSANGVRHAPPDPDLRGLHCWCVGEATAEAARAVGFRKVRSGSSDAAALARLIAAEAPRGGELLHLKGAEANAGLREQLVHCGLVLHEAEVYLMRAIRRLSPTAEAALDAREVRAAPVFSPRSAWALAQIARGRFDLSGIVAPAISEAAAAPLREAGMGRVFVVPAPTRREMERAMRTLFRAFAQE